jgi:hypothetical protein
MPKTDRALSLAGALTIAIYFWRLVRPSLHVYFSPDDLMNLYRSWSFPLGALIKANVLFFLPNPFYRPMASAWYRTVYHFAGFRPMPFHASLVAILLINIYLTYAVARRLSGSREVAAVAALLVSYHNRLAYLYFDTGYIYDVLCYCFYFGALLLYIRVRQSGLTLKVWDWAVFAVLCLCAFNSKEMALTLPLVLVVYECLYHRPNCWRWPELGPVRTMVLIWLVSGAAFIGRSLSGDALIAKSPYKPHLSPSQFLATSRNFFGDLTEMYGRFSPVWVVVIFAGLLAIAWASKSRTLKFAWLFLMLAPLPIAFITPRGPSQYYVPWFGWVLYAATLLVECAAWLTRRVRPDGFWLARIRGSALVLGLALLLYPHFKRIGWDSVSSESIEAPFNHLVADQIHRFYPTLPHNSKILFLNDPIPANYWDMMFLMRLSYIDNSLQIDCAKRIGRPDEQHIAAYDHVFDYVGGRFFELHRPWQRPPMPMVAMNYTGPEMYHWNWVAVFPAYPAERGEMLFARVADVGDGANAEIRVNGQTATITARKPWPGETSDVRLEFRVPDNIASGLATVAVTANGATGLPVSLPVK